MQDSWAAPAANGPLRARLRLPGSKSLTNRAYVLAALSSEPTDVLDPLESRDTRLMLSALEVLGASHRPTERGTHVYPITGRDGTSATSAAVDLGNAGTVARFTPALAALGTAAVRFDGDEAIRRRPIAALLDALAGIGVELDHGGRGAPPFTVRGHGEIAGGTVTLDSSASSQFLSALLLVGPRCRDGITVRLIGDAPPSEPNIAMTMATLRDFGATPSRNGSEFQVPPAHLRHPEFTVEPDLSTAAPFAAAPLVAGGTVRVAGWPRETTQPGDQLRQVLAQLGADVRWEEDGLAITGGGPIRAGEFDLHQASELVPVVAAVLCFGEGSSRISGVAHMRGHETDRLAALAHELSALGPRVSETTDGLHIEPAPVRAGVFETHDDHRLVMAGAVLALAGTGVEVANPATVGKTFPGFVTEWRAMLSA